MGYEGTDPADSTRLAIYPIYSCMATTTSDDDARVLQAIRTATSFSVVIITLFCMEWILSAEEEVEMLGRMGLNAPIAAYYVSRIASLGFCISSALLNLIPELWPQTSAHLIFFFFWFSTSAITLLFFFRVRAVYSDRPGIVKMFLLLWFLVVLAHLPNLLYFVIRHKPQVCGAKNTLTLPPNIVAFIYETLVFVGVSLKIVRNSLHPPAGATKGVGISRWWLRNLFTGDGLHAVSKSLVQSAQLYYGLSIGFLIATAVAVYLVVPYWQLLGLSRVFVSSALACKVFRMVVLSVTPMDRSELDTRVVELMIRRAEDSEVGERTIFYVR